MYSGLKLVFGLQEMNILLHGCISCQLISPFPTSIYFLFLWGMVRKKVDIVLFLPVFTALNAVVIDSLGADLL